MNPKGDVSSYKGSMEAQRSSSIPYPEEGTVALESQGVAI